MATIKCQRCGEILAPKKTKWLELSNTDGRYYHLLPANHISQGAFPFGTICATKELKETLSSITFITGLKASGLTINTNHIQ